MTNSINSVIDEVNSNTKQFQSEPHTVNLNKQSQDIDGQTQQQFNQQGFNRQQQSNAKVTPTVAVILSILITGLGQMINGQLIKGLTMLIAGFIGTFIISMFTCGIGAIIAVPAVWIISGLDAYNCTKILETGGTLGEWEFHIMN